MKMTRNSNSILTVITGVFLGDHNCDKNRDHGIFAGDHFLASDSDHGRFFPLSLSVTVITGINTKLSLCHACVARHNRGAQNPPPVMTVNTDKPAHSHPDFFRPVTLFCHSVFKWFFGCDRHTFCHSILSLSGGAF